MKNAFLILSLNPSVTDSFLYFPDISSMITNWLSTPVPMAIIIAAIAIRSMFQPIRAATPNSIIISEHNVMAIGIDTTSLLYLIIIVVITNIIAINPTNKVLLMNSLPNAGLILSVFTTLNFTGNDPVMRIV